MSSTKQLHARAQAHHRRARHRHDRDRVRRHAGASARQAHPGHVLPRAHRREGLRASRRVVLLELALRAARAAALQPGLGHRRHDRACPTSRRCGRRRGASARPSAWPTASASTATSRSTWIRATSCGARSSAARRAASSPCWRPRSSSTSPTRTGKPVYDGIQCYSLQKGAELEHVVGRRSAA